MYSNKASLKQVLETLPINSLVVIAAELMKNKGDGLEASDRSEAAEDALDSLYLDVLNAASARVENPDHPSTGSGYDFLQAVNWWFMEPGADSRKWYQRILGAMAAPSS